MLDHNFLTFDSDIPTEMTKKKTGQTSGRSEKDRNVPCAETYFAFVVYEAADADSESPVSVG
jgi:hypothetical protein